MSFLFSFVYLSIHFLPPRRGEEIKTKNEIRSTWDRLWNICSLLTKLIRSRWLDIITSFFFWVFMDPNFVSVHKNATKELGQYPSILTSRLVSNAYQYISCRPIQIWQGRTVQKIHFWVRNLSYVCLSGLSFPCNLVHKLLTSVLITQNISKVYIRMITLRMITLQHRRARNVFNLKVCDFICKMLL